ncbi:MAG: phosphotransferase [Dehalococcoidia bacterium]|uniref:aminoglycoside phosphotransferase family protein n=1 Tax=Candidatus Amarobacter glycogenicus TaxID=3140699 RepID=UPI0031346936|nr:phosphotransferase [Dehalococcoidia bacterium]
MDREVPENVRKRAIAAGAEAWLEGLPALVEAIERGWSIEVGRVYSGGSEAFVAEATLEDRTRAVLKLLLPRDDDTARNEITALRIADGIGCARLFRADITRGALLLERLGPPLSKSGLPALKRLEVLCDTAMRLWRPAPDCGLPTGAEKGRWLAEFIVASWERLGRPCSKRAVEYALECVERRIAAHDDARAVLVHGDIHEWNTLQADDGYKLVDPDGLLAEAEYDLGVIIREDPVLVGDPNPRSRARWLAGRTGCDETAIWEWAVVERLSTGLVCATMDYQPMARELLAAADRVARL